MNYSTKLIINLRDITPEIQLDKDSTKYFILPIMKFHPTIICKNTLSLPLSLTTLNSIFKMALISLYLFS